MAILIADHLITKALLMKKQFEPVITENVNKVTDFISSSFLCTIDNFSADSQPISSAKVFSESGAYIGIVSHNNAYYDYIAKFIAFTVSPDFISRITGKTPSVIKKDYHQLLDGSIQTKATQYLDSFKAKLDNHFKSNAISFHMLSLNHYNIGISVELHDVNDDVLNIIESSANFHYFHHT